MNRDFSEIGSSLDLPESHEARQPIRVLLVDDDEDYYVLTRALFSDIENQSYDLDWQMTYDTALEAMQRTPYDVCLLDYHLGGRDGLELLRTARQQGYQMPMIMLTGQGDRQVDLDAMAAGAADYLFKAKTDALLLERSIRYALDRTQTLETLREDEVRIATLYQQAQEHSRELERAYADLRRAEAMRDDLMHMIIHDLRAPLTSIMASFDLIGIAADKLPDKTLQHYLTNARAAARRTLWMIDDLLNLSKLEAGQLQPALESFSLPAMLADKQEAYLTQLTREGKSLTVNVPPNLPAVRADKDLISRVLDNLISNALKYTLSGGHIDIGVELNEQSFIVRVYDDGDPIPPEEYARIFEKFIQGSNASAHLEKGTGLGLAFCRLAIIAHGGKLWVESPSDRGSTFVFPLPRNPPRPRR